MHITIGMAKWRSRSAEDYEQGCNIPYAVMSRTQTVDDEAVDVLLDTWVLDVDCDRVEPLALIGSCDSIRRSCHGGLPKTEYPGYLPMWLARTTNSTTF